MDHANRQSCTCETTSCPCAGTQAGACDCGEGCDCSPSCECGNDCGCGDE